MKRIITIAMFFFFSLLIFANVDLEEKTFNYLKWNQPAGMTEAPDTPWGSTGYYLGEMNYDFIDNGLLFMVLTGDHLEKKMLSEIKDDSNTIIESEENMEINGLAAVKYAGKVSEEDLDAEFEIYHFPGPFVGKDELLFMFVRVNPTEQMPLAEFSALIMSSISVDPAALVIPEKYKNLKSSDYLEVYEKELFVGSRLSVDFEKEFENPEDIIGIYTADSEYDQAISWEYAESNYGFVYLKAPETAGEYEIRLYTGTEKLLTAIVENISVTSGPTPTIWVDKTSYAAGDIVQIHYSVPEAFLDYGWIGLVNPEIEHGDEDTNSFNSMDYIYLYYDTEGILEMEAPYLPGIWELRLNYGGSEYDFTTIEILSQDDVIARYSTRLSTSEDEYLTYEMIEMTYEGTSSNSRDWIGLYEEGAYDRDYIAWQYTDGYEEGYLYFDGVAEGRYDFRFFENDSFRKIGQSKVFEVKKPEPFMIVKSEFCREIDEDYNPVDTDYVFSKIYDEYIYLWLNFSPFEDAHYISWNWISPNGEYFDEVTLELPQSDTPGLKWEDYRAWAWLNTADIPDDYTGVWFVNVYVDDELYLVRQFELTY